MNLHDWTSVVFVQTAIITLNAEGQYIIIESSRSPEI